jgi:hypothetical protein
MVHLVTNIDAFRAPLGCQCKARSAGNGPALSKDCNAAMAAKGRSLRASQEAAIRGVMPLGKDRAIPCEASLAADHFLTR